MLSLLFSTFSFLVTQDRFQYCSCDHETSLILKGMFSKSLVAFFFYFFIFGTLSRSKILRCNLLPLNYYWNISFSGITVSKRGVLKQQTRLFMRKNCMADKFPRRQHKLFLKYTQYPLFRRKKFKQLLMKQGLLRASSQGCLCVI